MGNDKKFNDMSNKLRGLYAEVDNLRYDLRIANRVNGERNYGFINKVTGRTARAKKIQKSTQMQFNTKLQEIKDQHELIENYTGAMN